MSNAVTAQPKASIKITQPAASKPRRRCKATLHARHEDILCQIDHYPTHESDSVGVYEQRCAKVGSPHRQVEREANRDGRGHSDGSAQKKAPVITV